MGLLLSIRNVVVSATLLIRLITNFITLIPSLTFNGVTSVFHGAFATVETCQQDTLTLRECLLNRK